MSKIGSAKPEMFQSCFASNSHTWTSDFGALELKNNRRPSQSMATLSTSERRYLEIWTEINLQLIVVKNLGGIILARPELRIWSDHRSTSSLSSSQIR